MGCFSLSWLESLLIWLVIVVAIVFTVRLLIPLIASSLGPPWQAWIGFITTLLNIVVGAMLLIGLIMLVFDLLSCAASGPRLR